MYEERFFFYSTRDLIILYSIAVTWLFKSIYWRRYLLHLLRKARGAASTNFKPKRPLQAIFYHQVLELVAKTTKNFLVFRSS